MLKKQQGMGMVSWILSLSVLGLVFIFGLKLFPIYYDYFAVQDIIKDVAREYRGKNVGQIKLWKTIKKHLNVNDINYITPDNFKALTTKDGTELILKYDARTTYLWNIDLLVKLESRAK